MRARFWLPGLLCTLVSLPATALDGVVIGLDGLPLAAARVQLLGRPGSTVADIHGRFSLKPDPRPPFDVVVSSPDGVALRPIAVTALPATGLLELRVEPILSEHVTVISGATADLELPPAAAFTLLGRSDLMQRIPSNLAHVTEDIPGAGRIGDDQAAVPTLRGLASGRTLILLDDGRVTAERRAGPSATFLDPLTVAEVEVIRGPGSVAYGSDAFGGVIRARTHIPSAGDPTTVRYDLVGSSNTRERAASAEVGTTALGGGLVIGASYRAFDDYEDGHGEVVPNSAAELKGFRIGWQHELAGGNLRVLWRTDLARDVGKPSIEANTQQTYYPEENSHRLAVHFDRPGPGNWSRVSVSASWDSYQLLTNRDRFATATQGLQVTSADVDSNDYGLRAEAERPIGNARLLVGIEADGRFGLSAVNDTFNYDLAGSLSSTLHEVSIETARRDDLGAFAALSANVGRVLLSGGVREDRVTSKNSGGYFGDRDTSNSSPSGFAAATVNVADGLSLTLQGAHGFRDALISDRYYRGISGRGFITGNPDLKAETSNQLDAALRFESGPFAAAVYGYVYRISDLIERYKSGSNYYFRNRGEALMRGVELEGSAVLAAATTLRFGLQRLRGEVREDDQPTDGVPADGGFVTLQQDHAAGWWWLARLAAYARDDRPGPTEKEIPGYVLVDAGVGYRVAPGVQIELLGRNLTNRAYTSSADASATLAPGRTVQLSVRGTL